MIGHMLNDLAKAIWRLRELVDIWLQGRLQRDMQQPGRPSKLSRSRSADDLAAGAADPPRSVTGAAVAARLAGVGAGRAKQRGGWQAAPFASDVRRRLFHGFVGPVAKSSGTWSKCSYSESLCSAGRRPGMELYFSGYYTP